MDTKEILTRVIGKTTCLLLGAASMGAMTYFAVGLWHGVSTFVAVVVTGVPFLLSFIGIMWVSLEKNYKKCFVKMIIVVGIAWAWLYAGSIYIGLLKLQ